MRTRLELETLGDRVVPSFGAGGVRQVVVAAAVTPPVSSDDTLYFCGVTDDHPCVFLNGIPVG